MPKSWSLATLGFMQYKFTTSPEHVYYRKETHDTVKICVHLNTSQATCHHLYLPLLYNAAGQNRAKRCDVMHDKSQQVLVLLLFISSWRRSSLTACMGRNLVWIGLCTMT
ncbi:unnamed protein product [Amoebophrya sp. A120]|nr:unnamed protein product [Amoebophrya sp. A120]|eukprot:GSA120T00008791001.1